MRKISEDQGRKHLSIIAEATKRGDRMSLTRGIFWDELPSVSEIKHVIS